MNDCTDVRTSLGVYVLGAIDPGERSQVEAHLESCPSCRDELAGLAGLPALLGRVNEAQLDQVAGPPPVLLDGLLARAAARRRRGWLGPLGRRAGGRGLAWAPLAVAACLLLVVGALAGGLLFAPQNGRDGTAAPPPPSATSAAPAPPFPTSAGRGEKIAAVNPKNNIRGMVWLRQRKWGTEVELYMYGVPTGSRCRLLVVARDGQRDALGSWYVPASRGYGEYRGSTMFPRGQLYSFEVVGLDGTPLLTIPT